MEKISGIIPGSPRLTAVDLKDSAPVRPGTPTFGRPEGVSSLGMKDLLAMKEPMISTPARAIGVQTEMAEWRAKDAKHAALATSIADRFFMRNQKDAEAPSGFQNQAFPPSMRVSDLATASRPAGFKTNEVGSFRSASPQPMSPAAFDDPSDEPIELAQPDGLYPKGSFIDRTA